ncbi:alpha/beta fold hydrolase [Clostridium sp. DJ247]|uniref:alpha/beta fold hydrolase n=1 Tax=Clostridium sp. DJ247 TaxID=2726188 RepID=UPI001625874C|nr:alpha/beta hydrolase [Clostridium sp. DJ247]MBC2581931.1 alpha/beta hydrolase [Clostridium sp. DJ247]
MPKVLINGKSIYYETHGEGEPLVLLNGIMMSTVSWNSFIKAFSQNYKLFLIDFIDMGQSDKADYNYNQDVHVETLKGIFHKLGFEKVNMVGVSYGGEVAIQFAIKYGEMLNSLILANTTSYTFSALKDIGEAWDRAAASYDGSVFFNATMPYIYSSEFYEANIKWLKDREKLFQKLLTPQWYEGFRRLNASSLSYDARKELNKIKVPTLVVGAEYDSLLPVRYQEEIHEKIENSTMVVIKGAGHASMYEKPYEFSTLVLGFLSSYNQEFNII